MKKVSLILDFIVSDETTRQDIQKIASNIYGTLGHGYREGWLTDGLDADHINLQHEPIVILGEEIT